MRTLHYLLIAKELTGDSEVLFFKSAIDAKEKFDELTKPLIDICSHDNSLKDDVCEFGFNTARFNGGYNSELDSYLNASNHRYTVDSIEVADDITHYLCVFLDFVDDSFISFYNKNDAKIAYNETVDEYVSYQRLIDKNDKETWKNEETDEILFEELIKDDMLNCFVFTENYVTIRSGKIII